MKVGIDISKMHSMNKGRGVGFYTENLTCGLKKYTDIEVVVIEKESDVKVDLIHYPFFDLFRNTLSVKKDIPTVVTVHDVTPLVFSKHYPPGIKGKINFFRQKQLLKKTSAIITDSASSKKDISMYLNYSEHKIYPIHLAQSDRFRVINDKKYLEGVKDKYKLTDKFACFIGNVNWNKNILGIVEACIKAEIDLYLIGGSFTSRENLNHPELRSFNEFLKRYSKNPTIHILGYVDDLDVVGILNLATVFVFPTFYEGFGMPILEAQACGIPVVTGNTSSIPEIVGSSAVMVDPNNVEEIKEAIIKVYQEKALREKLIMQGFDNVKRFSWEKSVKETVEVYEKVLYGKNN